MTTTNRRQRYSAEELAEFEALILHKLSQAREEFEDLQASIRRQDGEDNRSNQGSFDDGASVLEKEQLNQLAARTQKHIINLEQALFRIKNGTYGICKDTGKLISKARLKAVPHTQQSIEAKLARDQ
ncbi:MAG: TraR/DksA family transcriptional regulator [Bernardetiaceae bacterium]